MKCPPTTHTKDLFTHVASAVVKYTVFDNRRHIRLLCYKMALKYFFNPACKVEISNKLTFVQTPNIIQ